MEVPTAAIEQIAIEGVSPWSSNIGGGGNFHLACEHKSRQKPECYRKQKATTTTTTTTTMEEHTWTASTGTTTAGTTTAGTTTAEPKCGLVGKREKEYFAKHGWNLVHC